MKITGRGAGEFRLTKLFGEPAPTDKYHTADAPSWKDVGKLANYGATQGWRVHTVYPRDVALGHPMLFERV